VNTGNGDGYSIEQIIQAADNAFIDPDKAKVMIRELVSNKGRKNERSSSKMHS